MVTPRNTPLPIRQDELDFLFNLEAELKSLCLMTSRRRADLLRRVPPGETLQTSDRGIRLVKVG